MRSKANRHRESIFLPILGTMFGLGVAALEKIVAIQHWLYGGMASGLGGSPAATREPFSPPSLPLCCLAPCLDAGTRQDWLVSYHLGQPSKLQEGVANGAILALTHVGLALILVLAGFAVISRAFAYGGRTPQFETASGVLIAVIGAFLLWRSLKTDIMLTAMMARRSPS